MRNLCLMIRTWRSFNFAIHLDSPLDVPPTDAHSTVFSFELVIRTFPTAYGPMSLFLAITKPPLRLPSQCGFQSAHQSSNARSNTIPLARAFRLCAEYLARGEVGSA